MACSAVLCEIPLNFIRHVSPIIESKSNEGDIKEVVVQTVDTKEVDEKSSQPPKKNSNFWSEIKSVFKCIVSPRMVHLICFFFFDGYQQVFIQSQFTRQVVDVASIGTIMGIYSIVDVVFSFIHGWLSDRFGHVTVVTLATVFEIAGIVISWFANAEQNWLNYLTGIVLAVSDAAYQTEVLIVFFIDD